MGANKDHGDAVIQINNKSREALMKDTIHGISSDMDEAKMEEWLLSGNENKFGIYQIRDGDDARKYRFSSIDELEAQGLTIDRDRYRLIYATPIADRIEFLSDRYPVLNKIFNTLNMDIPEDFHGHSASVSDIILLKWGDQASAHYIDSFGFVEIDGFLRADKAHEAVREEKPLNPEQYTLPQYGDKAAGNRNAPQKKSVRASIDENKKSIKEYELAAGKKSKGLEI